jgi:2-iminobutanoate/2-iminopropanoate deaminase
VHWICPIGVLQGKHWNRSNRSVTGIAISAIANRAVTGGTYSGGSNLDDICRVDVYVRNMEHFDAIHKVRREYFKAPAPASTMVEVCKMTSPDYLIEINAIGVPGNCEGATILTPMVLPALYVTWFKGHRELKV